MGQPPRRSRRSWTATSPPGSRGSAERECARVLVPGGPRRGAVGDQPAHARRPPRRHGLPASPSTPVRGPSTHSTAGAPSNSASRAAWSAARAGRGRARAGAAYHLLQGRRSSTTPGGGTLAATCQPTGAAGRAVPVDSQTLRAAVGPGPGAGGVGFALMKGRSAGGHNGEANWCAGPRAAGLTVASDGPPCCVLGGTRR
jgi:hypothetical protein